MIRLAALVLLLAASVSGAARADEVLAGLSRDRLALNATFDGSELLIYGAIRRSTPVAEGEDPLDVIVTLRGPNQPVTVWRRDRRAGIWVNVEGVRVSRAPSFYAVMSSGPLSEILTVEEDLRHRVSVGQAVRAFGPSAVLGVSPAFVEALIRLRTEAGAYLQPDGGVEIDGGTLFSTRIQFPSALMEGGYAARILLLREGAVIDTFETRIDVEKVGLERFLYTLAHEQPVLYGLMALLLAVLAGWGASEAMRRLRS